MTIRATILDSADTPNALAVVLEDGTIISAPIPAGADTTDAGIPALEQALAAHGYQFAGTPTDACGPVELERTR